MTAVEDAWPEEVRAALGRLGLGERYDPQALGWVVKWLDGSSAQGLVSSVKGRLFEMHVEARVESGSLDLPGNVEALRLATSTVQPGWDAETMVDGHVVGVVQMKAVASARELESHFRRYPDIPDVIVTTEVAAEVKARGMSVIDSGMSNEQLTEQVAVALDSLDLASAVHELVPEFAILVSALAAASRLRRGDDPVAVSKWLVAEVGIAGALHALGLAAELATGTAFVRPAVTLGAKGLVTRARTAAQATSKIDASRSRLELLASGQLNPTETDEGCARWTVRSYCTSSNRLRFASLA